MIGYEFSVLLQLWVGFDLYTGEIVGYYEDLPI